MVVLKFMVITIKLLTVVSSLFASLIHTVWFSLFLNFVVILSIFIFVSSFFIQHYFSRVVIFIIVRVPFYEYITMYLSILTLVVIWEFPDWDYYEQGCDYEQSCALFRLHVYQAVEWLGHRACKSSTLFPKVFASD